MGRPAMYKHLGWEKASSGMWQSMLQTFFLKDKQCTYTSC